MKPTRRTSIVVILALLLVPLGHVVAATALPAVPAQASSCADLVSGDRTLAQDLPGLNAPGALGSPELCLLYYAADDVYKGVILGLDDATQFEAAKADAMAQLSGLGVDLCHVTTWEAQGLQPIALTRDDQQTLPIECAPRIVAADSAATPLLPAVQSAFSQSIDATALQIGWRPDRPLIVKVYTDVNVAIPAFQQYMLANLPGETPDSLAQRTRTGYSWHKLSDPILGNLVLLNLTQPARTLAVVKYRSSFMYTSFAHSALIGGGQADYWFNQGLDSYQAERNAGSATGYLAMAAKAQRDGSEITPLSDLTTIARWLAHQRSETPPAVQARGHAALVYLTELVGFDPLIQLFRQNHDGTLQNFEDMLAALTGMDQPTLDQAFVSWLGGVTQSTVRGGAGFHVDVTVSPGSTYAEMTVTFDHAVPCGNGRQVSAGATVTVLTPLDVGGAVTVTGNFADATIAIQAIVSPTSASGTVRFANPATGCDTGPLQFGG